MAPEIKLVQRGPNSSQARKGVRRGHPELAVECPQCSAPIGRTCFMGPGYWGITHSVRKAHYLQIADMQSRRAEGEPVLSV